MFVCMYTSSYNLLKAVKLMFDALFTIMLAGGALLTAALFTLAIVSITIAIYKILMDRRD